MLPPAGSDLLSLVLSHLRSQHQCCFGGTGMTTGTLSRVVAMPVPVASSLSMRIADGDERALEEGYRLYGSMVRR